MDTHHRAAGPLATLLVAGVLAGCSTSPPAPPTSRQSAPPEAVDGFRIPVLPPPASFVDAVTHPYFPLPPGATWTYEMKSDEGTERDVVEVLADTRSVAGIAATTVHDRVWLDGVLIEDTLDWYAQDRAGNVWYLGEDTTAYENGKPPDKEGSWLTGVDGARAGIVMPAAPTVGDKYYQEYLMGHAEDRGEILSLDETATVPAGSFDHLVRTRDTTPLEPEVVEHKRYAAGVGVVLEEAEGTTEQLVSFEVRPASPAGSR